MAASTAKSIAGIKLKYGSFESPEARKAIQDLLAEQVQGIVKHMNQMKGAAMKVGQTFSMFGEIFFTPEVNAYFKNLQNNSTPLQWSAIDELLKEELGTKYKDLEIEQEPIASASIGQIHKAKIKKTGELLALKIQYPGVDKAIANDLKILRNFFQVLELFPQLKNVGTLYDEVEDMLEQELDYSKEAELIQTYGDKLKGDKRYVVPKVYPQYSTNKVLVMSYETGDAVDSKKVLGLPLEERNQLALSLLDLYLREIFEWGFVQTDPHLGNYRIRGNQWVLYDFGAVRKFTKEFVGKYQKLASAASRKNQSEVEERAYALKFLYPEDPQKLKDIFTEFCFEMMEPFSDGVYSWGESDVPKRLLQKIHQIREFKIRIPPKEIVFLDRKVAGVFIIVKVLKAKMNSSHLLEKYWKAHP